MSTNPPKPMGMESQRGMGNQQNLTLTKRLFEEVFTKGNLKVADELISSSIKLHDPAINHKDGLKAFKEQQTIYSTAFPDKKVRIEDIFTADDRVIVRWSVQATHKGELQGIAPTNKQINITGIAIYRFANGKVTEMWQNWDRLALLEQIGELERATALH